MKKLKYILLLILFIPFGVFASNGDKINKIDVKIELDKSGNAHITEVWDAHAGSGTEFYKAEYNLQNMEISNFKVLDETGKFYTFVDDWDLDASLEEKAYKNGFNYTDEGIELCWGKTKLGNHKYTISYDVSNFVFKTNDAQVVYWSIINQMEMMPKNFSATITGPNAFSDTLDVWGYGYKGYAYVSNGKISMSNEENTNLSNGDYGVILVKFAPDTFEASNDNTYERYKTFDDVYKKAEEGTFDYDYSNGDNVSKVFSTIFGILSALIWPVFVVIFCLIVANRGYKFGSAGSKINMKEINYFRDIPCDKDLFRAFFISKVYALNKNETDFIGSVFLKWLFEDKIRIEEISKQKFLGGTSTENSIVLESLTSDNFSNPVEYQLYNIIYDASKDGILEKKELEKWSKNHYNELFTWFQKLEQYERDLLVKDGTIVKEKELLMTKFTVDDCIKPEAIELAGLKKFLMDFSRMNEKSAIEVKLWKEYLMYAQIFGLADKVAKQFKDLYPEIITEMNSGFDFTDIILINSFSRTAIVSATSARSTAQAYSAGGGGFSSGGGGGGSFGGGGGGGR